VIQKPGSTVDQVIKIPLDWVIDGVEVYYGGSSSEDDSGGRKYGECIGIRLSQFDDHVQIMVVADLVTVDQVIKIPLDWVIDGVEVYYGGSSSNKKRISPSIDQAKYPGLFRLTDSGYWAA